MFGDTDCENRSCEKCTKCHSSNCLRVCHMFWFCKLLPRVFGILGVRECFLLHFGCSANGPGPWRMYVLRLSTMPPSSSSRSHSPRFAHLRGLHPSAVPKVQDKRPVPNTALRHVGCWTRAFRGLRQRAHESKSKCRYQIL